jgi:peptidoglycan/LPS O-acetylase OafA/YrhL
MRTIPSADRSVATVEPVEQAPARAAETPDGRERQRQPNDRRGAVAVRVARLVLLQVAMMLEPATSNTVPIIGVVLELVMWTLLAAMVAGLVAQRRWGLAAALAAGVFETAASIACPTTGHHPFGAWWFGQMACVLALVAISAIALQRAPGIDRPEIS